MAKRKILKICAMCFAFALIAALSLPAVNAFAVSDAPGVESVLSYYPVQQYILTFDVESSADGFEPTSITVPLSYTSLESYEVPVLTSDGSYTINVQWFYDPEFGLVYNVDLSETAQYFHVTDYRLIAITPGLYMKNSPLCTIACDSKNVTYTLLADYLLPVVEETSVENGTSVEYRWTGQEEHLTAVTSEEWMTTYFFTDRKVELGYGAVLDDAFMYFNNEISIESSSPITALQFTVPCFDSSADPFFYYWSYVVDNWDFSNTYEPPVYLPDNVDSTSWFADMAKGLLGIEMFPGITLGGIVFAMIAVPLVVVFLKLFAGG